MREIKFRAWYKDEAMEGMIYSDEDTPFTFPIIPENNVAAVMQYTGLKDKNGKEGYHHDLLSHSGRNSGNPIEIVWGDGSWHGQYVGTHFTFPLRQWEMDESGIIGNRWENPELLE